MDNLFLIASKQLRTADFSGYVLGVFQGNFNALLNSYITSNGYLGNNVLYISGGAQNVYGDKLFLGNIQVPYSGATTGSASSQQFVFDQISTVQSQINTLKTFTTSGAHLTGLERFVGSKYFEQITIHSGAVTGELTVPNPVNSGDAVPLIYLQNQVSNIVNSIFLNNSGNQNASGIISFFNGGTVYLPNTTNMSGGIPLSQLDSTGNSILSALFFTGNNLQNQIDNLDLNAAASVTGFAGVLTFNAQSGNIFAQGRGSVSCFQQGNIFNISGATTSPYTGAFLGNTQIGSGFNTQFISYGQIYPTIPFVFPQLVNNSGDPLLTYYVSGASTSGFNLVFSNLVNSSGYSVNYFGYTGSGSIVNTIQGPQGVPSLIPITPISINSYFPSLVTGSGLYEQIIPQNLTITGFSVSARVSGHGGVVTSGNIYSIDTNNNQTNLTGFVLGSGVFYSQSNFYYNPFFVTSPGKVGIDILTVATGMNKLSVGIFGFGT